MAACFALLAAFAACRPLARPVAASGPAAPDDAAFEVVELAVGLAEPMELVIRHDGSVLLVERRGAVKLYDPQTEALEVVAELDVFAPDDQSDVCPGCEDGLLGIALDPDHRRNGLLYLFYSPLEGAPRQHLSRFRFDAAKRVLVDERVLLEIPVQREFCCHAAGSLAFGPDGNLFVATGDDTNPDECEGYTPIDERIFREPFDAQRSSANANDLRGKILRIRPEPDGSYSIPPGNLFEPGTPDTRPEVYVMGVRNPFRISVDQLTGDLFWGDPGPDAVEDWKRRGPRGYDEINQATGPGFFGWPYFIGDNKRYRDIDFTTGKSTRRFDPREPRNDSPSNTGPERLPPARGALVWYPYDEYGRFPEAGGVGGDARTALAGPVFRHAGSDSAVGGFPASFDGKLFLYDWMRDWILVATLADEGPPAVLERFLPSWQFHHPIDLEFGPDGRLYVLEYGYTWYHPNEESRLLRIDYRGR